MPAAALELEEQGGGLRPRSKSAARPRWLSLAAAVGLGLLLLAAAAAALRWHAAPAAPAAEPEAAPQDAVDPQQPLPSPPTQKNNTPAGQEATDEDPVLKDGPVVVLARDAGCSPEPNGTISRVLRIVAEYCDEAKREVLRRNVATANVSCFDLLCYPAAYREVYVRERMPELADFYTTLPLPVMKADVFRVIVLYLEGGFYLDDDVDVFPAFPGNFHAMRDRPLIVGWERRTPNVALGTWCADFGEMLCNSLAMWAIGAQPGQQALMDVLTSEQAFFKKHWHGTGDPQDVLQATGPVRITNGVLEHFPASEVLGISAFGCGQAHSLSPYCDPENDRIWLRHRFEGKWRDQVGPKLFAALRGGRPWRLANGTAIRAAA